MQDPRFAEAFMATIQATPSLEDLRDLLADLLVVGALIGVVDLVDVHHHVGSGDQNDCCDSPWAESWYPGRGRLVHLVLEHPRPLEHPIPCVGRLGLWTPDVEVLEQLLQEVGS